MLEMRIGEAGGMVASSLMDVAVMSSAIPSDVAMSSSPVDLCPWKNRRKPDNATLKTFKVSSSLVLHRWAEILEEVQRALQPYDDVLVDID